MSQVIPALTSAVITFISTGNIYAAVAVFFAVLILGFISQALAPKPKLPTLGDLSERIQTRQFREAISTRTIIYGEIRTSGPILFAAGTDSNKFLHMIIGLSGTESEAIEEILFFDEPIYDNNLDGSGNVTSGRFANRARIKKHLGTAAEAADTDLIAEVSEWTTNHRLRGITYIYIRLQFDQDIYPIGVPSISAWVKGKKIVETRDSGTPAVWSPNPALCLRDYLLATSEEMGQGFLTSEIDDTFIDAAANICDEEVSVQDVSAAVITVDTSGDFVELDGATNDTLQLQTGDKVDVISTVTVPGGLGTGLFVIVFKKRKSDSDEIAIKFASTYDAALAGTPVISITTVGSGDIQVVKKAEARYTCNGIVISSRRPADVINDLLSSMGGLAVHTEGKWKITAASWVPPTVTLEEDDLAGPIFVQTRHSRRERFNAVKGIYVSPINNGVPADYPPILSTTYKTEDNEIEIFADVDFPFTNRPHTAQRLAKIALERHRQQISVQALFNLRGSQVVAGDNIGLTNSRFGWAAKDFQLVDWQLNLEGSEEGQALVINLTLRETGSAVYDWVESEETNVDPSPNTNLPNPLVVGPPVGLSLTTLTRVAADSSQSLVVQLTWTKPNDIFVQERGTIEIQFKLSSDSIFEPSIPVKGIDETIILGPFTSGDDYDFRLRAINNLGVRSAFLTFNNFTIGQTGVGLGERIDYGFVNIAEDSDTIDYGAVDVAEDSLTIDYGSVT